MGIRKEALQKIICGFFRQEGAPFSAELFCRKNGENRGASPFQVRHFKCEKFSPTRDKSSVFAPNRFEKDQKGQRYTNKQNTFVFWGQKIAIFQNKKT